MKAKGFTLIELAVVLAVIAVLAAVLTPLVTNYLDQARTARALTETKTVADAFRLYQRDTNKYPIFISTSSTTAVATWLAGPGTALTGMGGTTTNLLPYLSTNVAGFATNARLGNIGYRGPYIGQLESDPWGNAYYASAGDLTDATKWGYVLSAGADGTVQTTLSQLRSATFTVGGDDVAAIIK